MLLEIPRQKLKCGVIFPEFDLNLVSFYFFLFGVAFTGADFAGAGLAALDGADGLEDFAGAAFALDLLLFIQIFFLYIFPRI